MTAAKTISFGTAVFICLAAAMAAGAAPAEFFVSPGGDDKGLGTKGTPFASLARARDAVRELRKGAGLPEGGVSIRLLGGRAAHVLAETLVLSAEDSGTKDSPIIYEAADQGDRPVITSLRPITGWAKLDAEPAGVAPEAKGKLFVADVPKGWRFHYFYVNGVAQAAQPVASQPDRDLWHWPDDIELGGPEPTGMLAKFPKGTLTNLPSNGDLEMVLITTAYWNSVPVLRNIDPANSTARMQSKMPYCWPMGFKNYCLRNGLPLLHRPGQWCVDSAAGKVYYWPGDGRMDGKHAAAPALCELVRLEGQDGDGAKVTHVRFRNLTFMHTDRLAEDRWPADWIIRNCKNPDGAIFMRNVQDCAVEDCSVLDTGAYAISLDRHAQRVRIVGNELARLGCGGVNISGYGPGTTDVSKGNLISRNHIHHAGLAPYLHSPAISLYQSGGNEISLNLVHDLPYNGMSIVGAPESACWRGARFDVPDAFGASHQLFAPRLDELPAVQPARPAQKKFLHARDNVIRRNIISEYMLIMGDGGGVYAWFSGTGNQWLENVLLRSEPPGTMLQTLYMDDGVDGAVLKGNITWAAGSILNKFSNQASGNVESFPAKPAGLDARLAAIVEEVNKAGGWPGQWHSQAMPIMIQGNRRFPKSTEVAFTTAAVGPTDTVRYTIDGSTPTSSSPAYTKPFTLDQSATVTAAVFDGSGKLLRETSVDFVRPAPRPYDPGQWITTTDLLDKERLTHQGSQIQNCDEGSWACFGPIDFGKNPFTRIEMNIAVHPECAGGGRAIEIRLDTADGPLVGSLAPASTGDWYKFKVQSTAVKDVTGPHAIVLRFRGGSGVCNLNRFRFLN